MKKCKIHSGLAGLSLLLILFFNAKTFADEGLWQKQPEPKTGKDFKRITYAKNGIYYKLDFEALKKKLRQAPPENNKQISNYGMEVTLPMPDGKWSRFAIVSYDLMDKPLKSEMPEIRNFYGQGLDDPLSQVYLDFTMHGFHAIVLTPSTTTLIDPVFLKNTDLYCCYEKKDANAEFPTFLACGPADGKEEGEEGAKDQHNKAGGPGTNPSIQTNRGSFRKNYRIAISATAQYTAATGGSATSAFAAVSTVLNRANAIFGRELCLRFNLVSNSIFLMYTAEPDPFINSKTGLLLNQNNDLLNQFLGQSSYDIGHVFTNLEGGLAGMPSVCSGSKGRGTSGLSNPLDSRFLGVLCHEIGHQLGAQHTFNGTMGDCSNDNRHQTSAVEPGSGVTLMGYSGTCGTDNIGSGIDFFHSLSLNQMHTYIEVGNGRTCGTQTPLSNLPPSFSVTSPQNITIPIGTPYTLSATGTDPDGDPLTFSWEQDNVASTPGPPNNPARTDGPITRSLSPLTTGIRSIPTPIEVLLPSFLLPGNNLGTVSRDMNFYLTVRDNRAGGGHILDAGYNFSVSAQAGPFRVFLPVEGNNIGAREPLRITWDVANTHLPPVNCSQVAIKLSVDGANTFPYVLSASTPNDGEEIVQLPPGVRSSDFTAVIKVESIGNIFHNLVRGINIRDYCYSTSTCDGSEAAIQRVRFNELDNSSSCSPDGFSNYASNTVAATSLVPGQTYPFTLNWTNGIPMGAAAWIDYNNDGDFRDPGELLFSRAPGLSPAIQSVTIAASALTQGYKRMRVRIGRNRNFVLNDACTGNYSGETEDYLVNISGYCFGTSACTQGANSYAITRLQYRNMDVSSSCSPSGFTDHTYLSPVEVRAGEVYPLTVSTSSGPAKSIGVWIDKNYDNDFEDLGEFVFQTPVQTSGQFVIPFQIPGQPLEFGVRRVRVRLLGNQQIQGNQSCSFISLGETEDFEINITGYCFSNAVCADEGAGQHFIQSFQIPQLSNTNSGCTVGGFRAYHENEFLGKIILGRPTNGTMQISGGNLAGQSIWIDANNDGYFDPEEQFASRPPNTNGTWNFTLNVPNTPGFEGIRRLRIRSAFNTTFGGGDACLPVGFGETEDYMVRLSSVDIQVQNHGLQICRINPVPVEFSPTGTFGTGNQFFAEISDASGSFSNPVVVGNGLNSPIYANIPGTFPLGGAYRFRVRSTNPIVISETGPAFSLINAPSVTVVNPGNPWIGQEIFILGSGLSGIQRVYFGNVWSTPNSIFPDGTGLMVTVPIGALNGNILLTGPCETTGPNLSIRRCPFNFVNPQIIQATGAGCQNGEFRVTVSGATDGNPKVQLFKEIAPGQTQLSGNLLLDGTNIAEFTGLAPGPYMAVLRDNSTCRDTLRFSIIGQPCGLEILTPTSTDANGNDGTIAFGVQGVSCHGVVFRLKRQTTSGWDQLASAPTLSGGGFWVYTGMPSGMYRVIAVDGTNSCFDSAQVFIQSAVQPVSAPVIEPGGGSFGSSPSITISCPTPMAQIYYSLNGNTPVPGTTFTYLYAGPFTLASTTQVKAIALRSGLVNSPVVSASFTITNPNIVAPPAFSIPGGTYDGPVLVSINCSTPGSTIYYTLNGNKPRLDIPNSFTILYSGPLHIVHGQTVRAMAVAVGLSNSVISTASYTITNPLLPAATPVITPGTGSFSGSVQVSISSLTPGSIVYFTTNGNLPRLDVPNTFTQLYSGPFTISNSATIRAIALAPGFSESAIAVSYLTKIGARKAVDEENKELGKPWIVYPNPVLDKLIIKTNGEKSEFQMELFSIQGKKVLEWKIDNADNLIEWDLRRLYPGLYTLRIMDGPISEVIKIQKL